MPGNSNSHLWQISRNRDSLLEGQWLSVCGLFVWRLSSWQDANRPVYLSLETEGCFFLPKGITQIRSCYTTKGVVNLQISYEQIDRNRLGSFFLPFIHSHILSHQLETQLTSTDICVLTFCVSLFFQWIPLGYNLSKNRAYRYESWEIYHDDVNHAVCLFCY